MGCLQIGKLQAKLIHESEPALVLLWPLPSVNHRESTSWCCQHCAFPSSHVRQQLTPHLLSAPLCQLFQGWDPASSSC